MFRIAVINGMNLKNDEFCGKNCIVLNFEIARGFLQYFSQK